VTIIVAVKINDGIVVASDSATSFFRKDEKFVQSYDSANKIFNLCKGLPIGAATCGAGNIGNASISTLSKDLRERFQGKAPRFTDWRLDPDSYTMEGVARKAREFLLKAVEENEEPLGLVYWVFGYSSHRPLPELWGIYFNGKDCADPILMAAEAWCGPRWAGAEEALDRLILGRTQAIVENAEKTGLDREKVSAALQRMNSDLVEPLVMAAMPVQDAIDLARYLVDVTAGFMRFSIGRPKTVGGPVEVAAITKHEGFKWVARKHFYDSGLNPGMPDGRSAVAGG
jgi:hypothetical protein